MNFTTTIRQLRDRAGKSQQDIADVIGTARATYASLEAGRRPPNLDEINTLAEYYQISPIELIDSDGSTIGEPVAIYKAEPLQKDVFKERQIVKLREDKLRQVLLYIAQQVGSRHNVGATVINKLLYFIDFDYYEKYGESITGLTYIRNHYGPTAHMPTISATIKKMEKDGDLEIVETPYFNYTKRKYLPKKSAILTALNAQELEHIDKELERLADKSASELSDLSHRDMPWIATPAGDPIDYQLAMYRTTATTVREDDGVEL